MFLKLFLEIGACQKDLDFEGTSKPKCYYSYNALEQKKAAESLVRNPKTFMFSSSVCIWSPFLSGFNAEDPAGSQLLSREYAPVPLLFWGLFFNI